MYFYDIKEQKRTDRPDIKGNHLTIPFDVVLAKTLPKVHTNMLNQTQRMSWLSG